MRRTRERHRTTESQLRSRGMVQQELGEVVTGTAPERASRRRHRSAALSQSMSAGASQPEQGIAKPREALPRSLHQRRPGVHSSRAHHRGTGASGLIAALILKLADFGVGQVGKLIDGTRPVIDTGPTVVIENTTHMLQVCHVRPPNKPACQSADFGATADLVQRRCFPLAPQCALVFAAGALVLWAQPLAHCLATRSEHQDDFGPTSLCAISRAAGQGEDLRASPRRDLKVTKKSPNPTKNLHYRADVNHGENAASTGFVPVVVSLHRRRFRPRFAHRGRGVAGGHGWNWNTRPRRSALPAFVARWPSPRHGHSARTPSPKVAQQ